MNRYRIIRYIESGGIGNGWVAVDETDGRNVFLKTYKSAHPNDQNRMNVDNLISNVKKEASPRAIRLLF